MEGRHHRARGSVHCSPTMWSRRHAATGALSAAPPPDMSPTDPPTLRSELDSHGVDTLLLAGCWTSPPCPCGGGGPHRETAQGAEPEGRTASTQYGRASDVVSQPLPAPVRPREFSLHVTNIIDSSGSLKTYNDELCEARVQRPNERSLEDNSEPGERSASHGTNTSPLLQAQSSLS